MAQGISGVSKRDVVGQERSLARLETVYERSNRDRQDDNRMFLQLLSSMNRQIEMMSTGMKSGGYGETQKTWNDTAQLFQDISKKFEGATKSFSDSVKGLTETLEDLERERQIIDDPDVKREAHKAQRQMVRANQGERDKAAPGMFIRNLLTGDKSPVWLKYISNLIGIRPASMRKDELRERENLNVRVAQTKIDRARAKKRRNILGIEGEGENVSELTGKKTDKTWEIVDRLADVTTIFEKMGHTLERAFPSQMATDPLMQVGRGKAIAEGTREAMQAGENLSVGQTTLPFDNRPPNPPPNTPVNVAVPPIEPETTVASFSPTVRAEKDQESKDQERKAKQIRNKSSNTTEEGVVIIAFSKKTEGILAKIIGKAVKENVKAAMLEIAKETSKKSGEVGGEEEAAPTVSPETQVSEGSIKGLAKKLGKGIGSLVKSIPIIGQVLGKKSAGGPVSAAAGTGSRMMAMNPGEGITDSYDSMAVNVPGNAGGFNVVPKSDMKKLATNSGTSTKPENDNAGMEAILKQLLKTNEDANKILSKIAEKEPISSGMTGSIGNSIAKAPTPQKSTGRSMAPIGVL